MIAFKENEFEQIDELIYEFNSGGIKISNWIEFKNFTNKIISILFRLNHFFWVYKFFITFFIPLIPDFIISVLSVELFFNAFFAILAALS